MSTSVEHNSKVLYIGGSQRVEPYLRALEGAGYACDHTLSADSGMARLRDPDRHYDLVIWDTEMQAKELDDAFDRGRYRANMPTLLLLERLYPWVAAQGRRPGSLDYLIKPVSPEDVASAADQNVRVVKAKRYVEYMRQQVLELAELLAKTVDLLGPTGYGSERKDDQPMPLSDREEEIARMLAKGIRVTKIAGMLDISPHTVRNHFKSIFRKMNVHSQVELLARLRQVYQDV